MGVEYVLIGGSALYRCDYQGRDLQKMIYGKGWKKMDPTEYFMFVHGHNSMNKNGLSFIRITKDLALKFVLQRGGNIQQFQNN